MICEKLVLPPARAGPKNWPQAPSEEPSKKTSKLHLRLGRRRLRHRDDHPFRLRLDLDGLGLRRGHTAAGEQELEQENDCNQYFCVFHNEILLALNCPSFAVCRAGRKKVHTVQM